MAPSGSAHRPSRMREDPGGGSRRSRCEAAPDGRTRGVLRLASRAGGEVSASGDPGKRERATLSVRPRAPYLRRWAFFSGLLALLDDVEVLEHVHVDVAVHDELARLVLLEAPDPRLLRGVAHHPGHGDVADVGLHDLLGLLVVLEPLLRVAGVAPGLELLVEGVVDPRLSLPGGL